MERRNGIGLFPFFILFTIGCSESGLVSPPIQATYVPFSSETFSSINSEGRKKLNQMKNYALVKPGEFWMGSPIDEFGRNNDETKHLVKISKPFWISKFELTNEEWNANVPPLLQRGKPIFALNSDQLKKMCLGQNFLDGNYIIGEYEKTGSQKNKLISFFFEEVMPNSGTRGNWELKQENPKSYQLDSQRFLKFYDIINYLKNENISRKGLTGQKNPVTRVSHSQATAYCWKKSTNAHANGKLPKGLLYRLPTEAEWEYACRAGASGVCGLGSGERLSGVNACLNGSRRDYVLGGEVLLINRKKVAPINKINPKYPPNAWGIHDMHGNVMEWCHDFYAPYSQKSSVVNPLGPFNGSTRVLRGGSFYRTAMQCRSASRHSYEPSYRGSETGFRLVIGYPLL